MGKLVEFVKWLQGDQQPQSHQPSPLIKIKLFNKRLARQVKKMEIKEKISKKEALRDREEGDLTGARIHMRASIQYKKWAFSTQKFQNQMDNIQFRLQQAKIVGDFAGMAKDLTGALQGLQSQVKMPEIQKMLGELDMGFGKMDDLFAETSEILETSETESSTGVSDTEVDEALAAVDAEFAIDTGLTMPSVPSMADPDEKLESLEEEIKKLKKSQNLQ
jgi:hypothetical protein